MRKSIACVLLMYWGAGVLQAQELPITPSHVYQQVELLRNELELIRLEMGKEPVEAPSLAVSHAKPREVFYQALTLFRKADRLTFEYTGERVADPTAPEDEIRPADVLAVVQEALARIASVKLSLGITEAAVASPLRPGMTSSQVFKAIVTANRELNQLLDRPFAPADVYQQVTWAIAYASRLLDTPQRVATPPEPPPLERRKRPHDVYQKLLLCFSEVHEIGTASSVPMLELEVEREMAEIAPSDVHDLATLLVSELAHLHAQKRDALPPRRVFNPGRKLPSQVYRRVGVLCGQLKQLRERAAANADWLTD
jgi:hypothetical protein